METTFTVGPGRMLCIGNNLSTPNTIQASPGNKYFVGLMLVTDTSYAPQPLRRIRFSYACGTEISAPHDMQDLNVTPPGAPVHAPACPVHGGGCQAFGGVVDQDVQPTRYEQIACLKPSEARAIASVILSAATEARA